MVKGSLFGGPRVMGDEYAMTEIAVTAREHIPADTLESASGTFEGTTFYPYFAVDNSGSRQTDELRGDEETFIVTDGVALVRQLESVVENLEELGHRVGEDEIEVRPILYTSGILTDAEGVGVIDATCTIDPRETDKSSEELKVVVDNHLGVDGVVSMHYETQSEMIISAFINTDMTLPELKELKSEIEGIKTLQIDSSVVEEEELQ